MIIVAILNGWSASSRPFKNRVEYLVRQELPSDVVVYSKRAFLGGHRIKKIQKFISQNDSEENTLLVVGKSLGARNIIRAVNYCSPFSYRRTSLLSIDPCWPSWNNWSPNRNNERVVLKKNFGKAINIYLDTGGKDMMAGAMIAPYSMNVGHSINIPVEVSEYSNITHHNIIHHLIVKTELKKLIRFVSNS